MQTDANVELIEECPICMESNSFMIRTPCGHSFCFKCITKTMNKNTSCPLCRTVLIESSNEEDNNDEEDDYEYEFEDEDDIDDEDDDQQCDVENVIERFEKKGFGIMELMCILLERRSKTNVKYSKEYVDKITDEFQEMVEEMDDEMYENNCMENEDIKF
jgi:hypothetical protein